MSDINWNDLTKDEFMAKYSKPRSRYQPKEILNEKVLKKVIMKFIKDDASILKYVDERILEDKEFMIECIKINFDAIGYIACYYNGCYCSECESNTICDNCRWF